MSSRVFIRNLPSKFTESDLKSHFEKVAPVTDTKFLPKRRIGYVGFKTASDAQNAVKHFDKSFVRMTRISVEIAKSVCSLYPSIELNANVCQANDQSLPRAWSAHTAGSTANKRKAETQDAQEAADRLARSQKKNKKADAVNAEDPKLKEFLSVMQPSSASRTWTNDDIAAFDKPDAQPVVATVDKDDSDDEYDATLLKKQAPIATPAAPSRQAPFVVTTVAHPKEDVDMVESDAAEDDAPKPDVSDEDWLRSRTSRLLDLVEDAEELSLSAPKTAESEQLTFEQQPEEHAPTMDIDDRRAAEANATVETISETGRLFVRNLAYSVTEEELEERFSEFGELQEVSHYCFYLTIPKLPPLAIVMKNQIGTTYALHMIIQFDIDSKTI